MTASHRNVGAGRQVPADTAAIYTRLSRMTDDQTSTERQEAEARAWAGSHSLEIVKVFTDVGLSGYRRDVTRAGFEAALRALESGEVGTLLVWKLDRLSRRGIGQVGAILDRLEATGGRIVSVADGLDTAQPHTRMAVALLSEIARTESANIGVRTSSAKQALRRKGKWHGGSPPYGLRRTEAGFLEPDPEKAEVVRRITSEALAGRSLRSIAQGLNESGIPASRGGAWAVSTVSKILRSPVLRGSLGRGDDGEEIPSAALVSPGDAARVAQLIESRSVVSQDGRRRGARPEPRGLLTGLIRCDHCKASMTYHLGRGVKVSSTDSGEQGTQRPRYLCAGKAAGRQCPGNGVNAAPVEALVSREVLTFLGSVDPDPEDPVLQEAARRWLQGTREGAEIGAHRRALEQKLEDAEAKLADLENARFLRNVGLST